MAVCGAKDQLLHPHGLAEAADEVQVDLADALPQKRVPPLGDRERAQDAAGLTRYARGPFWLASMSNSTRSPPCRLSKLISRSNPDRWKKYSTPSSAAMNPNPRSATTLLTVPNGTRSRYHRRNRLPSLR